MISIIRSAVNSLASLGFLNFLLDNDIKVIGVDVTDEGLGKIISPKYFKVPFANQEKETIAAYTTIIENESPQWIISGPENEISLLAKHGEYFEKLGCRVFHSSSETLNIITNKLNLYKATKEHVPNPESLSVSEATERLKDIKDIFSGHVIVKPIEGRGSKGVKKIAISDLPQLLQNNEIPTDFIIQQCKSGKEYSVDTLHDTNGQLLNAVVRERVVTDSGISIVTSTVRIEAIFDHIKKLSEEIRFKGLSCIQFIEDNDEYFLTDVNPRFGGGAIVSLKASPMFANNLLKILRGEKVKPNNYFDYNEMTMFRSYTEFYQ